MACGFSDVTISSKRTKVICNNWIASILTPTYGKTKIPMKPINCKMKTNFAIEDSKNV